MPSLLEAVIIMGQIYPYPEFLGLFDSKRANLEGG